MLGKPGVRYQTLMVDPPWPYGAPGKFGKTLEHRPNRDKGESRHGAGSEARYGAMSMADLSALPVADAAAENAHLYLWTTNSFVVEAHQLAKAWGFRQSTIITWSKIKQGRPETDPEPSMKMGYYYRGATEHCLFCVRGKLRLSGPAVSTAFFAPRTPHSVKPDSFYQMVEEQSPGPYLELFARRARPGWHLWGDQAPADDDDGMELV